MVRPILNLLAAALLAYATHSVFKGHTMIWTCESNISPLPKPLSLSPTLRLCS